MEKLKQQLIGHEGYEHTVYVCPGGYQSIGVGRNLEHRGLTDDEINYLLNNDIADFTAQVEKHIDTSKCNPARKAVLINMAFNLGIHGLLAFKKTIAAVEHGDWDKAAIEMFDSRWAVQVGERAEQLTEQMKTGEWYDA
ncbi:glycoside hydrolase family protein [Pseudoalteromonas sp. SMS1]|uniref:glycoside hydrolase family protein n=1 Tax=Pseudoalteromonas sp. SMS1 TaxID=2908894 RepID=UPI001F47101D|nr:glycoside hydrolase family protein [Pseudoalteromonas sp. SMS1]MCF2855943.1 glycoside hydrolase family protein [Pseudoalteromonas sp. SMS1]